MRRTLAIFFILAASATSVVASKRVTIEQLEHLLAASQGKQDADLAWQIGDLQLTERLGAAELSRLQNSLTGEKSREALLALADTSAFLAPSQKEIPATAAPGFAEQRRILSLTVDYVRQTVPQLPNFFATRATTHFEDTPQLHSEGVSLIPFQPLHAVATSSATVLYRDGQEIVEPEPQKAKNAAAVSKGLTTRGVFGPILGTVLLDAAQNKLAWSHWEQGQTGPQAVFGYSVPKDKSHYEVDYCCVAEEAATIAADVHRFRRMVGYHGYLTLDLATGVILRLSVEAELKPDDPVVKANILVEYGAVEIGGKTYTCPVKSISYTVAQQVQVDSKFAFALANLQQPMKTSLNDTSFVQYHLFRAETRVLTANDAEPPQPLPPLAASSTPPTFPVGTSTEPASIASQAQPGAAWADAVPASSDRRSAPANLEAKSASEPPPAPTAAEPPIPEMSVADTAAPPDVPLHPPSDQSSGEFTLRTTTRLVDVGLVAYDKKRRPVTDLRQEDFEIYDNGRKQQIRYFGQAGAGLNEPPRAVLASTTGTVSLTNRPDSPNDTKAVAAAAHNDVTILLLDGAHLAFGDLTYAREEILRFLETVPPDEPVGLYVMKNQSFQVLAEATTDRSDVAALLKHWMPSAQDLAHAQHEEARSRQQMEYVHSVTDLLYVNGNNANGIGDASQAVDPQLRSLGDNPSRDFLQLLPGVARHLAANNAHKSLVLVSSDNLLADWSDKAPSIEKGDKHIDPLALRAQEALNEAHISIYPLDASQLEAGGVGASFERGNVQLSPVANSQSQMAGLSASQKQEVTEALSKSQRDINPGRVTAQMQQDTHPIQSVFRELAEATGGRAVRRAGDIASELNAVTADGRAAYLLSFTPDEPADGQYHVLTVKLAARHDITLRYRTGYLYEKEPATLKERFKQAVWQPRDLNEIGLRAVPVTTAQTALNLTIAVTDLAMAEASGRWTGMLEVFLIERDDADLHARISGHTVSLSLLPATYQRVLQEGLPFNQPLPAHTDHGSIRVVVIDENSGRLGSITLPSLAPPPR